MALTRLAWLRPSKAFLPIEAEIARLVDFADPADAKHADNLIRTETGSNLQRHGRRSLEVGSIS